MQWIRSVRTLIAIVKKGKDDNEKLVWIRFEQLSAIKIEKFLFLPKIFLSRSAHTQTLAQTHTQTQTQIDLFHFSCEDINDETTKNLHQKQQIPSQFSLNFILISSQSISFIMVRFKSNKPRKEKKSFYFMIEWIAKRKIYKFRMRKHNNFLFLMSRARFLIITVKWNKIKSQTETKTEINDL